MPGIRESGPALVSALSDLLGSSATSSRGQVDPAEPFESVAAAALNMAAEPRLAARALATLREAGLLNAGALATVAPIELDDLFRQAKIGIAPRSTQPLPRLARWAVDQGFDSERAASLSTESLRESWRALRGLGPATVDALLLRGLGRPTYPVDRATYRVLARHGWIDPTADYDEARSAVESLAPGDAARLDGLSLAFDRVGRQFCKPRVADCASCPLRPLLPQGGPIDPG